jgi:hypothetical protein
MRRRAFIALLGGAAATCAQIAKGHVFRDDGVWGPLPLQAVYSFGRSSVEVLMPMYYFNLQDDDTVEDTDGTDLPDIDAARIHATGVARELTSNGGGFLTQSWSGWMMSVQDEYGTELFSLTMSDFGDKSDWSEEPN